MSTPLERLKAVECAGIGEEQQGALIARVKAAEEQILGEVGAGKPIDRIKILEEALGITGDSQPRTAASVTSPPVARPSTSGLSSEDKIGGSSRKSSAGRQRKGSGSRFDKKKASWRSSVFQQSVIKEGYLEKQSSGMIKQWQRRYFELSGHYLKYYEDKGTKSDDTVKGTIDVREIAELAAGKDGVIMMATSDGGKINLKAPSETSAASWVDAIEQVRMAAAEAQEIDTKIRDSNLESTMVLRHAKKYFDSPDELFVGEQSYKLGKEQGMGMFGPVRMTTTPAGKECVMKQIDKAKLRDPLLVDKPLVEMQILFELSKTPHANIIQLFESFETSDDYFFSLEFGGPDIWEHLKGRGELLMTPSQRKGIFRQVILGLRHVHAAGFCHLDLSLDNLVASIDEQHHITVKIIDFGLARRFEYSPDQVGLRNARPELFKLDTVKGKPTHVAPEVLQLKPFDGEAADMWACGRMLLELLIQERRALWRRAERGDKSYDALIRPPFGMLQNLAELAPSIKRLSAQTRRIAASLLVKNHADRKKCNELLNDEKNGLDQKWVMAREDNDLSPASKEGAHRLTARVMSYTTLEIEEPNGGKKLVVHYEITVTKGGKEWTVQKRYSAFETLNKLIQKRIDHMKHPLPPKQWLGRPDPGERKSKLDDFLQEAVYKMNGAPLDRTLFEALHVFLAQDTPCDREAHRFVGTTPVDALSFDGVCSFSEDDERFDGVVRANNMHDECSIVRKLFVPGYIRDNDGQEHDQTFLERAEEAGGGWFCNNDPQTGNPLFVQTHRSPGLDTGGPSAPQSYRPPPAPEGLMDMVEHQRQMAAKEAELQKATARAAEAEAAARREAEAEALTEAEAAEAAKGVQEVVPTWTSVTEGGGCTLVRDGGALEKRGGKSSYDTGAFSNEAITRKEGGSESQGLKWRAATTNKYYELGLSHEDGGVGWSKKDFGMWCRADGYLFIYEQGSQVQGSGWCGTFGGCKAGDELEIRVVGDTVSYHKNGALLHTSTRKPVFPLRADCSFKGPGARAEGVRLRC
eukprot:g2436.t1